MNTTEQQVFIKSSELEWEQVADGVVRQILGYDDQLMMVRVIFKKGAVGAAHRHPHRQVSLVEQGTFEVEIDGKKEVLQAGDSYFIPPDAWHGAVALTDGILVDVFTPQREEFLKKV